MIADMAQQVNRCLKDKWFDHIDHALGRPVDPMGETYREYFCTDATGDLADKMRASPHWNGPQVRGDMAFFFVSGAGRQALAEHLKTIGDKHRLYTVSYDGNNMTVVAVTAAKARYKKWLDISDCRPDLTFGEFQRSLRVRLAAQ